MTAVLSAAQARRTALRALGLDGGRVAGRIDRRHLRRVVRRLRVVQIDSVSVLARAHLVPFYSRLGPYDVTALHAFAYRHREVVEHWAHDASLIATELVPQLRWRMAHAEQGRGTWGSVAAVARDRPAFVRAVRDEVADRGPLRASELGDQGVERRGPWWSWSDGKRALEHLLWAGELMVADRTATFERRYDLTERVLPRAVLEAPTPSEEDAQRRLIVEAAAALGVATADDLADFWRLRRSEARHRITEAVEAGELVPAEVEGWGTSAYLHPATSVPRHVEARALVVPFDPLVWHRPRVDRLFGFHYRIEIYTPAAKRRHGYYVLPFLLGDQLVARVDLKADRGARVLRVPGAYAEAGTAVDEVAEALADELREMASWLDLDDVAVGERGGLAAPLAAALR